MSTVSTPYGMKPVSLVGGRVFAGSTRIVPITASYGTAIGFGDIVKLSGGYIVKDTGTTACTPLGIFMGCEYIDANTSQLTFKQNWTASNAGTSPVAYVCDDPYAVFQIQADGAVTQAKLGQNATVIQGAVSGDGNSTNQLHASTINTTNTFPLRIIGFVNGPFSAVGDTYTDCLVIWNAGMQLYQNATGTA
jgi:hypothetical protein